MNPRPAAAILLAAALLAGGWLAAGPWSHVSPPPEAPPLVLPASLQEGDLVFRQGHDAVSGVVLAVDPSSQFSHVGILARRGDAWVVIHSLPPDAPGDPGGVRVELLSDYLSPANARRLGIYRLKNAGAESIARVQAAVRAALEYGEQHTRFDGDFDLNDHRRLYCTELVWLAFRQAGIDLAPAPDWLDLPLRSGYYILPSTLMRSEALLPVT